MLPRHRAVDEEKSLSDWMVALVEKELVKPEKTADESKIWIEAMIMEGMPEWFYEKDFPLEDRKSIGIHEFNFED